jgi:S-DNA-T family DNA segregation ATPase FtsK/SpoIIIE
MSARIIATTVFEIVREALAKNADAKHQCFRIKNLQEEEICELVALWDKRAQTTTLAAVTLIVAEDLGGRIPPAFVSKPERSITFYRNHNEPGLVYLETKVQSDEQGLQNIFTLRDSNFLDGSFDEYTGVPGGVPGLMLVRAWTEVAGTEGRPPSLLAERVLLITRLIHPEVTPVPVRHFVSFLTEVCERWVASKDAKDAMVADRLIGECLFQLEMFPDPVWHQGGADVRVKRRMELNARHAELVSGNSELDPEDLVRLAETTEFVDEVGVPLPLIQRRFFAELCGKYAVGPTKEIRRQIPYTIFEQLFKKDSAGLKLGDRVRVEIEDSAPMRLSEFDDADVVQGLNSRLQADAERLLVYPAPEGKRPLIELLSSRTRKTLERVAAPPTMRFSNPIVQLVRVIRQLRGGDSDFSIARMHVECADVEASASCGRGLFAFLYGATLQSLIEATQGVPGACELSVNPELVCQVTPPVLEQERSDDEESSGSVVWSLALKISLFDESDKLIECLDRVEWAPENPPRLAFFWLLCVADDSPIWSAIGELHVPDAGESDDWLTAFVQRDQPLSVLEHGEICVGLGYAAASDSLIHHRQQLKETLRHTGLSIDAMRDYVAGWSEVLAQVRVDHVPDGSRPQVLEATLGLDMLAFVGDARRLMLPLQAMRLRWLATHLQRCLTLAIRCMTDTASFATGDGGQYLDLLESLSPHETPPTALGRSGEILHSRSEASWFEDFAPLASVSADVSVDQPALAAIAARIKDYIDAHPFKRDGLSLLLLLPPSDSMPAQLIEQITKGPYSDARISLTIAAPKARWERIARRVEALPGEERKSGRGRLFPARDLAFLEFEQGSNLDAVLVGHGFDVAVVTHVLQEGILSQQNTEPSSIGRPGAFDPVLDRPIRLEPAGSGGAMSIVMLPRAPDVELETWGTLVVRANRSCPVSPSQPENIDFVELRINFQDSARVFRALHQKSHWVITLERHISREQIESVEAGAPDVLSVEAGIGSNGLSTLIVSSHSGRGLIEARLAKKLRKLLPTSNDPRRADGTLEKLASRVYDETRKLSPHLALQAMGVARVTEEILGLCIARRFADQEFPAGINDGLLAWLSLDEHTSWFGGAASVRADMCRVVIERSGDGQLDVDLLILEGKFRQNFDPHGTLQVTRTSAFFSQILASTERGKSAHVDSEMWRERFLSAIESIAEEALCIVDDKSSRQTGDRSIPPDIRQLFRDGAYRLRSVQGIYSICLWESTDPEIICERKESVTILRSSRVHVFDLIARPERGITPGAHDLYEALPQTETRPVTERAVDLSLDSIMPITPFESPSFVDEVKQQECSAPMAIGQAEDYQRPKVESKSGARKGMTAESQAVMYDEILGCFASHNVSVTAALAGDQPIVEGPASILFKIRAGSGVDPRKLFEKAQSLKLKLELDQDQNVSFDIDKGYVTIDVPKKSTQRYFVNAADMWLRWQRPENELSVPLGEDRYGDLVVINFSSSNSPHLLVAGTTGSGKSEALNTMLFGLVKHYSPDELRLMLVDPKGTELVPFENSPHLIGSIGWEDSDALLLLKSAVEEMQHRYEAFRSMKCRSLAEYNASLEENSRLPWWLIVLDEYADLTHDTQSKKDIEHELKRLAQKARAAGIHVIIATQKPSAEVISTNLRSNLPAQLALRVKSGTESRVVLDEQGAENLNGKGDALLKADGKLLRVQCGRVDSQDLQV